MRSDGEDKLDLADIGGETGTAAHGGSIALPGRMPKTPAVAALARSVLCEQGLGFAILVSWGHGRRRSMQAVTDQAEPILRYPITR